LGSNQTLAAQITNGRFGPSLSLQTLNCPHEIRTSAQSPYCTDGRKYHYSCNRSKDPANDSGASTNKAADRSSDQAAHNPTFHSASLTFGNTSVDVG
jgi:hypothetical protein